MSYVLFTREISQIEKMCGSVVDTIGYIETCLQKDKYEKIQKRLEVILLRMYGNILCNPYIPKRTKKKAFHFIIRRGNKIW